MAATGKSSKSDKSNGSSSSVRRKGPRDQTATSRDRLRQTQSSSDTTKSWTFLTNHAHVLILLDREPDLVLREVATRVGITERAVQRIVHELEEGGFLIRNRVGRRNVYEVSHHQHLRHDIESHRSIGDLLELMEL